MPEKKLRTIDRVDWHLRTYWRWLEIMGNEYREHRKMENVKEEGEVKNKQ